MLADKDVKLLQPCITCQLENGLLENRLPTDITGCCIKNEITSLLPGYVQYKATRVINITQESKLQILEDVAPL